MNTNAVFTNARRRPVRLFPVFDWADEGVLFDPMTPGTPWDDVGENALFEIRDNNGTTSASCGVWWNGLYHPDSIAWNPFAPAQKAANVQIKDGAILELYLDYDGDGGLDVEKSIRDETCYVPHNDDDDNQNGIPDKLEGIAPYRPPGYSGVANEDDLRKAMLYAWVEKLDGVYTFDVYQNHPAGSPLAIRLWKDPLKKDQLEVTHQNPDRKFIGTIQVGTNSVSEDFWMEGIAVAGNYLTAKAECFQNNVRKTQHDGNESTYVYDGIFDLAIDSNNDGEIDDYYDDRIENYTIALGKHIPLTQENQLFEKMRVYADTSNTQYYDHWFTFTNYVTNGPGAIEIYYPSSNGGDQLVQKGISYPSNAMLWQTDARGYFIELKIYGKAKNNFVESYKDVYENDRQTTVITATQSFIPKNGAQAQQSLSDTVRYFVAESNDFLALFVKNYNLRTAVAAKLVYEKKANTAARFGMELAGAQFLVNRGIPNTTIATQTGYASLYSVLLTKEDIGTYTDSNSFGNKDKDVGGRDILVTFRGTVPGSLSDWRTNVIQAFGLYSARYNEAISIGTALAGSEIITFVGHSLGGGLASSATLKADEVNPNIVQKGYTFNAAGLNQGTITGNANNILAFHTDGDILTQLQEDATKFKRFFGLDSNVVPEAVGVKQPVLTSQYAGIDVTLLESALGKLHNFLVGIFNFIDVFGLLPDGDKKLINTSVECHSMEQIIYGLIASKVSTAQIAQQKFGYERKYPWP